jgi:Tol biopolymer transport system component
VLDFGIAKMLAPQFTASGRPLATLTTPAMTEAGAILGTAAYMSPEQARGKAVDQRTDIWAFGCVLYEMLTGRPAFGSDDVTTTLARILERDADITALPHAVTPGVRRALRLCLQKDVKDRVADIRDVRLALKGVFETPPDGSADGEPEADDDSRGRERARSVAARYWVFASLVIVTVAMAAVLSWRRPMDEPQLVLTPLADEKGVQTRAVWSPDGKSIAYAARGAGTGRPRIYVRDLVSASARPVTGELTDPGVDQWTTTGRIFYADRPHLWWVSPVGAMPEVVAGVDLTDVVAGAIARDGSSLAVVRRSEEGWGVWTTPLSAIRFEKYDVAPFESSGPLAFARLEFSPDGSQLLLTWIGPPEQIWVLPFPPDRARPPRPVLQQLTPILGNGASWLPDNQHIVVGTSDPKTTAAPQLTLADTRSGRFRLITNDTRGKAAPAVSPDGTRLVYLDVTTDFDIVTVSLADAEVRPMIATQSREEQAAWSADGSTLTFMSTRSGQYGIWVRERGDLDRPLVAQDEFPMRHWLFVPAPSPDGTRVIFQAVDWETGASYLWMRSALGGALERVTADLGGNERAGSWSPDGAWYVYLTREKDGSDTLKKVRTSGNASPEVLLARVAPSAILPIWSRSGEWILVADSGGLKLVSPDGGGSRELGIENSPCGFDSTGQTIYCLRAQQADGRRPLVALDLMGNVTNVIGFVPQERGPASSAGPLAPSLTLWPTRDGSSMTYSVVNPSSTLWLMDGLAQVPLP